MNTAKNILWNVLMAGSLMGWMILLGNAGTVKAESGTDQFKLGYKAYLIEDYKTALDYWQPLAKAGNAEAQYHLGMMYYNGQGVPVDFVSASRFFRSSANQGDAGAQYLIGEMRLKGKGVAQDAGLAGVWFKKAAQQDYPDAQYELGDWYFAGKGGEPDYLKAYVWFSLAEANGIRIDNAKRKKILTELSEPEIKMAQQLAEQWWQRWGH